MKKRDNWIDKQFCKYQVRNETGQCTSEVGILLSIHGQSLNQIISEKNERMEREKRVKDFCAQQGFTNALNENGLRNSSQLVMQPQIYQELSGYQQHNTSALISKLSPSKQFTKLQLSQMQNNSAAITSFSKTNKQLSELVNSKLLEISQAQSRQSDDLISINWSQQSAPTQTPNQAFLSESSSKGISPINSYHQEFSDDKQTPLKHKTSLFRVRKYQSERSIQIASGSSLQRKSGLAQKMNIQSDNKQDLDNDIPQQSSNDNSLKQIENPLNSEIPKSTSLTLEQEDNENNPINYTNMSHNIQLQQQSQNQQQQQPQLQLQYKPQQHRLLSSDTNVSLGIAQQENQDQKARIRQTPRIGSSSTNEIYQSPILHFKNRVLLNGGVVPSKGQAETRIGSFPNQEFPHLQDKLEIDELEKDHQYPETSVVQTKKAQTTESSPQSNIFQGGKISLQNFRKPASVTRPFVQSSLKQIRHIKNASSLLEVEQQAGRQGGDSNIKFAFNKTSQKQGQNNQNEINMNPIREQEHINIFSIRKPREIAHFHSKSKLVIDSALLMNGRFSEEGNQIGGNFTQMPTNISQTGNSSQMKINQSEFGSKTNTIQNDNEVQQGKVIPLNDIPNQQFSESQDQIQIPQTKPQRLIRNSLSQSMVLNLSPKKNFIVKKSQANINLVNIVNPSNTIPRGSNQTEQKTEKSQEVDDMSDDSFMIDEDYTSRIFHQHSQSVANSNPTNSKAIPQSAKSKPVVPLLNLKNLCENGSQINNFFIDPNQNNQKASIKLIQHNISAIPNFNFNKGEFENANIDNTLNCKIQNNVSKSNCFLKSTQPVPNYITFQNLGQVPQTNVGVWSNNSINQGNTMDAKSSKIIKTQESDIQNTSQIDGALMMNGLSGTNKDSIIQQNNGGMQENDKNSKQLASKRPQTPTIKKLNLQNLSEQVKKFVAVNSHMKDEGFSELQQSRLILPQFGSFSALKSSSASQSLMSNANSNDSTPTHQFINKPSLERIDEHELHAQHQSSSLFNVQNKTKEPIQSINSLFSGLLTSQNFKNNNSQQLSKSKSSLQTLKNKLNFDHNLSQNV